ncbi:acetamidase/formamidase family protein [Hyphomicrobium sp. DY-1]|uniref:acetamidase/formamidase family protein n=1 Tax=Hyphomicrobium sp. DY-1 TaxID=3075650 RepID=UPI0039C18594
MNDSEEATRVLGHHRVSASPDTVHWGFFDASLKPVISVTSGDTVTLSTVSGRPMDMPAAASGFIVPDALSAIHAQVRQGPVGHILTGPVELRGAKPGHVLEVRIKSIELNCDWGYNIIFPLAGALPDDFEEFRVIHFPIDRKRKIAQMPWGLEIPLTPFFGVMATAPPKQWGAVSSLPPRRNGGNIDNKELVAGTTLYLPIHAEGALFSVGDGHAAQGDGEVCSAIETGLTGTFELHLREDLHLDWPLAETANHIITMAFHPDLDDGVVIALRDMLKLICARTGLSREDAYSLCSIAADIRVTQVVNGNKGIHVMLDKSYLVRDRRELSR